MKIGINKIDKNSREPLPIQLEKILRQRIECGYYVPGKKIDSVRTIAKAFGVSTVSVQTALSMLKDSGALQSVPGSGLFVCKDFIKENAAVNIAFVFPKIMISPNYLSAEDWVINSEIHLGLLKGAEIYGAKINFIHLDESMPTASLNQRMKEIRQNDAVLFVGNELNSIRDTLAKEKYVFNIISEYDNISPDVIQVSFDNRNAIKRCVKHAIECGCKSAGIITFLGDKSNNQSEKAFTIQRDLFVKYCQEYNFDSNKIHTYTIHKKEDIGSILRNFIKETHPEFLLCNYSYLVNDLYQACQSLGLTIGKDIKIMGKAPGIIFQNLTPSLTYLKPPAFETAIDIVNYASRLSRGSIKKEELNLHKNNYLLIEGKSTKGDIL